MLHELLLIKKSNKEVIQNFVCTTQKQIDMIEDIWARSYSPEKFEIEKLER